MNRSPRTPLVASPSSAGRWWTAAAVALAVAAGCAGASQEGGTGTGGNGSGFGGNGPGNGGRNGSNGGAAGGLGDMLGRAGTSGNGTGDSCNKTVVEFTPEVPTVAVIVDRSSSMLDAYGAAGSRWNVLKSTLIDANTGVIKQRQNEIRFGLTTYTSYKDAAPTCPVLESINLAMGNFDAISAVYGKSEPPSAAQKGETPTSEAILEVTKQLEALPAKGAKVILLATDGEPDTCPGMCTGDCPVPQTPGYPRDPNCGQDESISAVQAAFKKGIRTYVVAIGNDVGADHLQALANAGAGLPVTLGRDKNWLRDTCRIKPENFKGQYVETTTQNATAYRPENREALSTALANILNNVRACKFQLKGKVMGDGSQGTVNLLVGPAAAPKVEFVPNDQWKLNGVEEVELLGAACEKVRTTQEIGIDIDFPCGVFAPG